MRGDGGPEDGPVLDDDGVGLSWPLLDRYLTGGGSAEERRALDSWLARHPESQGELASLRSFVREPGPPTLVASADHLWAGMARRMASRWRLSRWAVGSELGAIAAGLLIAVVLLGRGGRASAGGLRDTASSIVATIGNRVVDTAAVSAAGSVDGLADTAHIASGTQGRTRRAVGSAGRHARGTREVSRPRDGEVPPVDGDVGARAVSLTDDRPGAADTHWP